MKNKEYILVVDDEESIVEIISYALEEAGFGVLSAGNIKDAEEQLNAFDASLIILDLMLPDESGFEFCKRIRDEIDIPIIILSAKTEEIDKILGLELGADDYVTKPFSPRELVSRVKAQLRRESTSKKQKTHIINIKDLTINTDSHEVFLKERLLKLTNFEYQILLLLARNLGKTFPRLTILEHIWGGDFVGDERTVDVHIHNLREKLEKDPQKPKYLVTVRSYGYRLREPQ